MSVIPKNPSTDADVREFFEKGFASFQVGGHAESLRSAAMTFYLLGIEYARMRWEKTVMTKQPRLELTNRQKKLIIQKIVADAELISGLTGRAEAIRAAARDSGWSEAEIAAFCPHISFGLAPALAEGTTVCAGCRFPPDQCQCKVPEHANAPTEFV